MQDNNNEAPRDAGGAGGRSRRWRRTGLVTGILGALLTSMVAFAAPASAAIPGIQVVSNASVSDSNSAKSVTATCPAAKRLVGTGAEITGGQGEVLIDDLRPNGGVGVAPTSVTVMAVEEDAYAGSWRVTAYAICANPLAGLERRSATSVADSDDFNSATAACPAGKWMVGTGFALNGSVTGAFPNAIGNIVVDDFRPNGSPPLSLTVGAYEADPNYVPNWSVTAYAICANAAAVPGLVRIDNSGPFAVVETQTRNAGCPAGRVLTGLGGQITGGTGEVIFDDLRPAGLPPASAIVRGEVADPPPFPNWSLTSYAICANA